MASRPSRKAASNPSDPSVQKPPSSDPSSPDPQPLELDTLAATYMHRYQHLLPPLLLISEALLCTLIILHVPYTDIDWSTYMAQCSRWLGGEWNYAKLTGPTGPLVYPVYHLYLYSGLYYATNHGTDIFRAQCIFLVIYLATLACVFAAYRRAGAPAWLLIPLVLSKRLHSIFLLRLFNDAICTLALWAAIYALQRKQYQLGAVLWSVGAGIKMTMLNALPGLLAVLVQGQGGLAEPFFILSYTSILHLASAYPFLYKEVGLVYFTSAFDFGRRFVHTWSVNWKFVPEGIFLSRGFAGALIVLHLGLLVVFAQRRWLAPSGMTLQEAFRTYIVRGLSSEQEEQRIAKRVTPRFVMDTVLTSTVIGLLCARTLHYQFYAYLGWATPYLLWRTKMPSAMVLVLWGAQEFYWLVYPSDEKSSSAVVMLLSLQVLAMLYAGGEDGEGDGGDAEGGSGTTERSKVHAE